MGCLALKATPRRCYSESTFNENGTLDVVVMSGEYVIHAWMEDHRHHPLQPLPQSDCYFFVR